MNTYKDALPMLKQLKELVDSYDPIKYESSSESKLLSEKIPQVYGAVQELYRNITGDLKVELSDRGTKNIYPNYFEAGYLSGITIHAHKGRQELLQVIGRVDAEIKSGKSNDTPKTQSNLKGTLRKDSDSERHNKSNTIKERFENHPVVFGLSLIIIGFLAGFSFNEWVIQFKNDNPPVSELSALTAQIESLTQEHNRRLGALHTELRENEKQAVYNGNPDSIQKKHEEAAQRLRESIEEENQSYKLHLEQLMKIAGKNGT